MLDQVLANNLNFDIIIATLVLIGIVFVQMIHSKKDFREKAYLLVLLVMFFVFFNLAFIEDAIKGIPIVPLFVMMGVCAIGSLFLLFVFYFHYPRYFHKLSVLMLLIFLLIGIPFYAVQNVFGFGDSLFANLADSAIMLGIFSFLNNMSILFLMKEGRR